MVMKRNLCKHNCTYLKKYGQYASQKRGGYRVASYKQNVSYNQYISISGGELTQQLAKVPHEQMLCSGIRQAKPKEEMQLYVSNYIDANQIGNAPSGVPDL